MFAKLNLHFSEVCINRIKGDFYENHHDKFVMYDPKDLDYINNFIQDKVKFNILPSKIGYFEICGPGSPPHTDGYVGCSLNFILDAADCVTLFWKIRNKNYKLVDNFKITNEPGKQTTETKGYKYEDLEFVSMFKAETGEAWLLDVREIHSVSKPFFEHDRKILTFRWDPVYSFQEVLDSIKIL
jgi:hypothetical protein